MTVHQRSVRTSILVLFILSVTRSGVSSTEVLSPEANELALFRCLQASYRLPPQVIEHLEDTNVFTVKAINPDSDAGKFQIETSLNGYDGFVQLSVDNLIFVNRYKNTKSLRGDEETAGTFRLIAEDRAERIIKFVEQNPQAQSIQDQVKASFRQCPFSSIGGSREDTPNLERLANPRPSTSS